MSKWPEEIGTIHGDIHIHINGDDMIIPGVPPGPTQLRSLADYIAAHKRAAARQYVLKTLTEYCVSSPLADEPDVHAEEYSGGKFTEADMIDALKDVKQFLESASLIVEGVN